MVTKIFVGKGENNINNDIKSLLYNSFEWELDSINSVYKLKLLSLSQHFIDKIIHFIINYYIFLNFTL